MKCILILGDGMADEPIPQLMGKTPLEYARTPHMDRMAREGACGMLHTIPDGFEAGSDIANMSILGYAPEKYCTGRGPLEAISMGVDLAPTDIAYRCNIVTVRDETMADFSAGHISSAEGAALFESLAPKVPEVVVKAGVSYRNLLVVPGGRQRIRHLPMISWGNRSQVICRGTGMRISFCPAWKRAAKCSAATL